MYFLLGIFYITLKAGLLTGVLKSSLAGRWFYCFIFIFIYLFFKIILDRNYKKQLIKEVITDEKNKSNKME